MKYIVMFKREGIEKIIHTFEEKVLAEQYAKELNAELKLWSKIHFIVKGINENE